MKTKTWIARSGILLFGLGILIIATALAANFTNPQAREGDKVSLHYALSLDDGSVYYTSAGGKLHEYTLGEGSLLPGFEAAIAGMRAGDSKSLTLPYMQAYGPYQPELVVEADKSQLPEGSQPVIGQQLQTTSQSGNPLIMTITAVSESTVTLDANHPLAGRNLTFDIQLVGISDRGSPAIVAFWSMLSTYAWAILALLVLGLTAGLAIVYLRGRHTTPVLQEARSE